MRLATKFITLTGLSVLLTAAALTYWGGNLMQSILHHELMERGDFLAHSLAESNISHIINNNLLPMEQAFERIRDENDDIEYIFVIGFDGQILVHTFAKGFPVALLRHARDEQQHETGLFYDTASDTFFIDASAPLLDGMPGEMHVGMNDRYARTMIKQTKQQLWLLALVITLLTVCISYLVSRRMVLPLASLTRHILGYGHTGQADLKVIEQLNGSVEIRDLGSTFKKMVEERRLADQHLYDERERAQVTLHSIGDGVITTDDKGTINYLNPVAEDLTGWSNPDAVGQPLAHIMRLISEVTGKAAENPVERCLKEGRIIGLANHTALIRKDGSTVSIEDSAAPIRNSDGQIIGVVMVFHDVSQERELKKQLSFHASHDSLTGLINRREFDLRLANIIEQTHKNNSEHALIYIDLDQFKVVNDTCGHVAGDELLKQVGSILDLHIRDTDTLARLGGDEFGALLVSCPLAQAQRIADNILNAIREIHFSWDDRSFRIGASIGLVSINNNSLDTSSLLGAADVACYAAKEAGRNRIHIYTEDDTGLAQRRTEMHWASHISQAIDEDRLTLYGQFIQPLNGSHSRGPHIEVLVRMLDEQGNLVPPGAFLPAAERYNIMPAIDRWVVSHALRGCSDCRDSQNKNSGNFGTIAINLSGTSLGDNEFLNFIRDEVRARHVEPEKICFEVTETAAISNLTIAMRFISEMKSLGCRFALDDFGSGLSSFAYLKNLPVDYLKIDGGFVKDIMTDPLDRSMVESIHNIGKTMGIQTIAEYAENGEIVEALRVIGVDYAQGYGVGRPKPLCELCKELQQPG